MPAELAANDEVTDTHIFQRQPDLNKVSGQLFLQLQ